MPLQYHVCIENIDHGMKKLEPWFSQGLGRNVGKLIVSGNMSHNKRAIRDPITQDGS